MVSFNNIRPDVRVPLFYAEVDNSQAFQFQQSYATLIVGQRLNATADNINKVVAISSSEIAREEFGAASQIAKMVEAYRRNDPFTTLYCLPLEDGAGVAASGSFAITGTATEAGTLSVYIAGERVQITVLVGEDASTIATNLKNELDGIAGLQVSAAVTSGTVTVTALHAGAAGNDLDLRMNYYGLLGGEKTPAGLAVAVTAMSGGTGQPDLTTAIANMGDEPYDYIIQPYTDTGSLNKFMDLMNDVSGRWAYSRQIYGHVFSSWTGTSDQLMIDGKLRNDPHMSILGYYDSPTSPWEAAAMFGAQAAKSLSIDPARPLQTLPMIGFMAPPVESRYKYNQRNDLLLNGVATSYVEGGYVRLERSITTYQENAFGSDDTSFLDIQTLATLAYVLRFLRARITQKFPRHKLANDGTRFGAGQAIVTPNIIRSELVASYTELEAEGLVENIKAFKENLIVERDANDPNRLNIVFPPDLVNQLRVFAVLAQFRLQYSNVA